MRFKLCFLFYNLQSGADRFVGLVLFWCLLWAGGGICGSVISRLGFSAVRFGLCFLFYNFQSGADVFLILFVYLFDTGICSGITRGLCSLGGSLYLSDVCSLQFDCPLCQFFCFNLSRIRRSLQFIGSLLRSVGSLLNLLIIFRLQCGLF